MGKFIRIGNGCGFWGDNLDAPVFLARDGRLHYLTLEYLAELTMSILALQKQRDPTAGYAGDFIDVLERLAPVLHGQPNLRIITNAGGMNPQSCAAKARAILDRHGLADRKVGIVTGDDLMPRIDDLLREGHTLTNLDTGESLESIRPRVVSANAYLGAEPIARALGLGASIVITGRVADASLTVAPLVYDFGWNWNDWDRLSAATVAGHLIECGAQATGGLWCNWTEAPNLADVGYPVVNVEPTGRFVLSKAGGTGGAVNVETVSEQLLYEVGDPRRYLTPDVTADFTSVTLEQVGKDEVQVSGARGQPASDTYKVSLAYRDGFAASGTLAIFGPNAADKARRCGEILLERVQRAGYRLDHSHIECVGAGSVVPRLFPASSDALEVMLRVAVQDGRRIAVERFAKEFAPLVTSGPPGVTGYTTGRPQVREVFAYWPALLSKQAVHPCVDIL